MDEPLIHINIPQEVTTSQYNDIIAFVSKFTASNGKGSVHIICDKYPLRLSGKISELSPAAKQYYDTWSSKGVMRNMSVVKTKEKL